MLLFFLFLFLWFLFGEVVMAASESSSNSRTLDQTPTWAVAVVCAVIIIISLALEKSLHKIGTWLTERHKKAMFEALLKVQAELMVLGFISLLLTFGQTYIARICISAKAADSMLPCPSDGVNDGDHRRKLLWFERRYLAADSDTPKCKEGFEPLISTNGLHQLHILIFFLAVFHVLYSAITMMLGRLKIRGWKDWEKETSSHGYEFSNDPARFRLTHETSFVRAHTSFWTRIPFFFYVGCFLRQFFRSVNKADYMTLRNGFINVHLAPGSQFNFQKYIKRSLEDDFKIVVGVSPVLWASFVIFLLVNVNGSHVLFWASLIPVIIILAVGTKLQAILTRMALDISERHAVVQGIPLVEASNNYFWFGRPQLILYLIHFALFQNAFQITYFLWIWYSFGTKSCFHADFKLALIKASLGVGVLCLCSYITLPLYALVTQMGSSMKKSIFDEHTSKALKRWHMAVKKKQGKKGEKSLTRTLGSPVESTIHSSGPTLHRFKTTGHSTRSSTFNDQDGSHFEADPPSPSPSASTDNLILRVDQDEQEIEMNEHHHEGHTSNEDDFTFVKPAPSKNHDIA
ncbi:MLO-like protein [Quillaja saponaria]|uniref:MLO-like protein n=1 Tax=Quillaja saponaria TaxID=32244 RepID=A0AAD7KQC0_QUISA|nr:MLO-like protein [Quillaja saponaria]